MSESQYAIIETGAKQYRVEPKQVLEVERLVVPPDQREISLEKVLLVRNGEKIQIGNPFVSGAKVVCDRLGERRAPKVISFKYKRRKASRRKKGHRQTYTRLLVKEIIS